MLQLQTATGKFVSTATMKIRNLQISKPMEQSQGSAAFEDEADRSQRADVRESVRRKVEHDIYYVEQCNPWLDLRLMILTAWRLIREVAHFVGACFVLPTDDEIHRDFRQSLGTPHDEFGVACFPVLTMPQSIIDTKVEIPKVRS
jgi:hypothetical protein